MHWDARPPRSRYHDLHRHVNRLFEDFLGGRNPASNAARPFPEINAWVDDEDRLLVESELPGLAPDDVQVTVEDDVLTLRGERKTPDAEGLRWHRRERGSGAFSRSLRLPVPVEASEVEASFSHGVLTVILPKAERARSRKIEIQVH